MLNLGYLNRIPKMVGRSTPRVVEPERRSRIDSAGNILLWLVLAAVGAQAQDLRVMTFNVRYANPGDGENAWVHRAGLAAEMIRAADPDVMGTQELLWEQGEDLAARLPEYRWIGVGRRGDHSDEHMGLFYKAQRLFVLESGNFWLSPTPDVVGSDAWGMSLPRMATWARFRTREGDEFYVYNTHFPHRREDGEARVECAKVLAEDIERRVPEGAPVIVTGDFNADAGEPPHAELTIALDDAWEAALERSGPETTWSGFSGEREGRRIDWVLFRGPWSVEEAAVIDHSRGGRYPSDHYPVLVRFRAP